MKQINSREFQKSFSKVAEDLKEGQTVAVTKRGKPLGLFTKVPARPSIRMPDFAANLAEAPYSLKDAERIIREVVDDTVS